MTRPLHPDSRSRDLLLDAQRGELDPADAAALQGLKQASVDGLQAEADALDRFLATMQGAHEVKPDDELARTFSARIRAAVGREEGQAREARTSRVRLAWAKVLAVSVAAHVLLLGFVAWRAHQPDSAEGRTRIRVILPEIPFPQEDLAELPALPDSPWLPETGDLGIPSASIDAPHGPGDPLPGPLPLLEHRYDHPRLALGPMLRRTEEDLKRSRLRGLGIDEDTTLEAVARGLRGLARRQKDDGSFPKIGRRTPIEETALALLPFLGDGHGSGRGAYAADVVAPGVRWLRGALRDPEDLDRVETPVLGMAVKALAEDYMLSYGGLLVGEAQQRADELGRLTDVLVDRQRTDGSFPGADKNVALAIWPMWGLDAAARTGTVLPPASVAERFATYYDKHAGETRADQAAGLLLARHLGARFREQARGLVDRVATDGWHEGADPFLVATIGSGLLRQDPDAFRRWSRGLETSLGRRLPPTGIVQRGDPIADTAMVLLALQAAYRTY